MHHTLEQMLKKTLNSKLRGPTRQLGFYVVVLHSYTPPTPTHNQLRLDKVTNNEDDCMFCGRNSLWQFCIFCLAVCQPSTAVQETFPISFPPFFFFLCAIRYITYTSCCYHDPSSAVHRVQKMNWLIILQTASLGCALYNISDGNRSPSQICPMIDTGPLKFHA